MRRSGPPRVRRRGETVVAPRPPDAALPRARARRSLAIANTSAVSASGAFAGVVLDEGRRLLAHLRSVDVTVFAGPGMAVRDGGALPADLRVHYARLPRRADRLDRPLRLAFEIPALSLALLRTLRRERVEAVRADDALVTGLPAAFASRLLRIPFYIFLAGSIEETAAAKLGDPRSSGAPQRVVRWLEGHVLRSADGVLAVNRALASRARNRGATLVETTTSFVDAERFSGRDPASTADRGSGPLEIRFVGRLEREKGILDLLDAFSRVVRPESGGPRLEYVGGGSRHQELGAEIARRSLGTAVSVRGPIAHDEIPRLLASTDILVLPSYTEGSPVVVFEAMLMGVPVVATRVGSLPDLFRDGEDIVFVEVGSPEAIGAGLQRLIDDADLRRRIGEAGARKARAIVGAYIPTQVGFIERVVAAHEARTR